MLAWCLTQAFLVIWMAYSKHKPLLRRCLTDSSSYGSLASGAQRYYVRSIVPVLLVFIVVIIWLIWRTKHSSVAIGL